MDNTTTPNRSGAAGLPRAVWIGGGLMALTIIALATTLVVKGNGNETTADNAAVPLVAATTTPGAATTEQSSVAKPANGVMPVPVNESTRPVHHATTSTHHETRHENMDGNAPGAQQQVAAAAPVCTTCGVIEGYAPVQVKGQNNGVGAVAGGLGGALVGNRIAGNHDRTIGGVVGAVGGGLLGNAIEKHQRKVTVYDVNVRMQDGTLRTVRESTSPAVGEKVRVEADGLHART